MREQCNSRFHGIEVLIRKKDEAGHCNCCFSSESTKYNIVYEINISSSVFRLCNKCKDLLINKLEK